METNGGGGGGGRPPTPLSTTVVHDELQRSGVEELAGDLRRLGPRDKDVGRGHASKGGRIRNGVRESISRSLPNYEPFLSPMSRNQLTAHFSTLFFIHFQRIGNLY